MKLISRTCKKYGFAFSSSMQSDVSLHVGKHIIIQNNGDHREIDNQSVDNVHMPADTCTLIDPNFFCRTGHMLGLSQLHRSWGASANGTQPELITKFNTSIHV